jgi:(S)-2-hydroxyglutarate dehydrogenase
MNYDYDCAIIGGGILGLSVAMMLGRRQPDATIVVLEKEPDLALHQTGRNSGVIHSGIYYKPGSLKARFAREGNRSMVAFCAEHGLRYEICGKVIVATREEELPLLENLYRRGLDNHLDVRQLSSDQVREIEPHVRCLGGIKVPSTGIVSFRAVCAKYVELIRDQGGDVVTGAHVKSISRKGGSHVLETTRGVIQAGFLINCGGLHSDRVARQAGLRPEARIVPFRGEYYELRPERRHLVKSLIYPVPNPAFPFLGVHFTRMIDGSVHAGPNAVLALKREGYHKTDFNISDLLETLAFPGFWKLVRHNFGEGMKEIYRSLSKKAFCKSLQQLIPEVTMTDLVPTHAGVRAQALMPNGSLVDDFLVLNDRNSIHVCNAPSPAATASLDIGRYVAEQVPELRTAVTA